MTQRPQRFTRSDPHSPCATLLLSGLRLAADALAGGNKTDMARAAILSLWLAEPESRPTLYKVYRSIFLTTEGTVRQKLAGKDAQAVPGVLEVLESSEEHTSELQSRMRSSYDVLCFKKNNKNT